MSAAGVTQRVGGSGWSRSEELQEPQPCREQDLSHEKAATHLPTCYWGGLGHPAGALGSSLHKGLTISLLRGGSSPGQTRTPCPAFQIWVSPLVAVPGWSPMGCHISAIPPEQSHVWNLNIRIMGLDNLASLKICKYCM